MFVPLHVKSEFSPGYGTASVEELVRRVSAFGLPALALTDVENLCGQVRFHRAAHACGVKPVTGLELRAGYRAGTLGHKAGRLFLLARDRGGYESLCRIITHRRGKLRQSEDDPLDCLRADPRGVFFLTDDAAVIKTLLRAGVAVADVRFLLIRPGTSSAPRGVRPLADPDVVMADSADVDLHVLRVAIRHRQKVTEVSDAEPSERSLPTPEHLRAMYRDVPEALAETLRVAEQCNLDLGDACPLLPSVELVAGETAQERLAARCWASLQAGQCAGRWQRPAYEARLRSELTVVAELNFAGYFLIVGEIADAARQRDIAVAGRGSAAGSLMAHVLGVTAVDPVERGLYFERFLNAKRKELPDIDLDVAAGRRDQLIAWVFTRFGAERVAMVSTYQTFRRRGAFREGLKALGMRPGKVERFCQRMPPDELEGEPLLPLPLHILSDRYRAAVPLIERLIGRFQHLSVHPGAVVMAEPRLDCHVPLERAPKGVRVTQLDKRALAHIGLVKFDLLGNRALNAIAETCEHLDTPLVMADGDPATLETLRAAHTIGCFQIETPALRATLRRLPVSGISDLTAALAIVRPGPASGEAKAAYLRRANGTEAPEPPHFRLAPILNETHGMMLYEEDLMASIAAMTGGSLEDSDEMRTAIARADDAAVLNALKRDFVTASVQNGVAAREVLAVWRVLARFAAYSFNKAHAASYAELAWQSAYLKTHHPVAFAAAVLNSYGGHYPLRTVAAEFARRGMRLLAPHVNSSETACTVEAGAVRVGLAAVKRLTARNRRRLIDQRTFNHMSDLLARVGMSHRELEALILCGACDGLAPLAEELYPLAHRDLLERLEGERPADAVAGFVPRQAHGKRAHTYRSLERIKNELNFLEMHLTDHPMRVLRDEATRVGCIATSEVAARRGELVRIAGVVAAARRLVTRGGHAVRHLGGRARAHRNSIVSGRLRVASGTPWPIPGRF